MKKKKKISWLHWNLAEPGKNTRGKFSSQLKQIHRRNVHFPIFPATKQRGQRNTPLKEQNNKQKSKNKRSSKTKQKNHTRRRGWERIGWRRSVWGWSEGRSSASPLVAQLLPSPLLVIGGRDFRNPKGAGKLRIGKLTGQKKCRFWAFWGYKKE